MSIGDWFDKMMPDPEAWAAQFAATPVTAAQRVVPAGEPASPFSQADLTVRKVVSYIEVPDEALMAYGLIPDTRPPLPPTPWRYRLRNKVSDWREHAARRAFKLIAGYDVPDGGDW